MPKHRRGTALQTVLARIWGLRDAQTWTARGHSREGRVASLRISSDQRGVTLTPSHPDELWFAPLQVGRIRAAPRTAIEAIEEPGQAVRAIPPEGFDRQVRPTMWPPNPAPRVRAVLDG